LGVQEQKELKTENNAKTKNSIPQSFWTFEEEMANFIRSLDLVA